MKNDPRKITAMFFSKCAKCDGWIEKGMRIIYYPATRKAYHEQCGEADYQRSREAIQDEDGFVNRSL